MSKQDKADSRCDARIMNELKKYSKVRPRNLDFCVVFEKVDALRSRYRYESTMEVTVLPDEFGSELVEGISLVVDMMDSSIVARETSIDLYAMYRKNQIARQLTCDSAGFQPVESGFRSSVLK